MDKKQIEELKYAYMKLMNEKYISIREHYFNFDSSYGYQGEDPNPFPELTNTNSYSCEQISFNSYMKLKPKLTIEEILER